MMALQGRVPLQRVPSCVVNGLNIGMLNASVHALRLAEPGAYRASLAQHHAGSSCGFGAQPAPQQVMMLQSQMAMQSPAKIAMDPQHQIGPVAHNTTHLRQQIMPHLAERSTQVVTSTEGN